MDEQVKQFHMPNNQDIHYKFFAGKLGFLDIGYRLVGAPFGVAAGVIIMLLTGNAIWSIIVGLFLIAIGWWIGSRMVFDKTIPLLKAMVLSKKLKAKNPVLINKRAYEEVKAQEKKGNIFTDILGGKK